MNGLYLVSGADDETTTDDKFYFFSNGQIQSEYKGLALYDNEWFYLENGYLDTNTNGIVEHDGGKFIVAVGRIAKEANGLWQDPKDKKWYFALTDRFRPSTPVWQAMMENCSMLLRENLQQIIRAQ